MTVKDQTINKGQKDIHNQEVESGEANFLYNKTAGLGKIWFGLLVGAATGGVIGYNMTGGSVAATSTGAAGGGAVGGYMHHQYNVNKENQEKIKVLETNLDTEKKHTNAYKEKADELGPQVAGLQKLHKQTLAELVKNRVEVVKLSKQRNEMLAGWDEDKENIAQLTSKLVTVSSNLADTQNELIEFKNKYEAGVQEQAENKATTDAALVELEKKYEAVLEERVQREAVWDEQAKDIAFLMKQHALSNSQSPHMQVPNKSIRENEVDSPDVAEAKTISLAYQVPTATIKEQLSEVIITAKVLNEQGVFSRKEGHFEQDRDINQAAEQVLQETGYEILPAQNN